MCILSRLKKFQGLAAKEIYLGCTGGLCNSYMPGVLHSSYLFSNSVWGNPWDRQAYVQQAGKLYTFIGYPPCKGNAQQTAAATLCSSSCEFGVVRTSPPFRSCLFGLSRGNENLALKFQWNLGYDRALSKRKMLGKNRDEEVTLEVRVSAFLFLSFMYLSYYKY